MSTRSFIHARLTDGSFSRIYCHFDGYLDGVGLTLFNHYTSQEKVEQLIALGDLSSLKPEIGVKHDFDYAQKIIRRHLPSRTDYTLDPEYVRLSGMCNAYGRDRGETGTEAVNGPTLLDVIAREEYVYVWDGQQWFVSDADLEEQFLIDSLIPLAEALRNEGLLGTIEASPVHGVNVLDAQRAGLVL